MGSNPTTPAFTPAFAPAFAKKRSVVVQGFENKIVCGNTFELVKEIEDNSLDLIVCDGPYGVTNKTWDRISSVQEFNFRLIEIFSKKLKQGGVLYLFGKHDSVDFVDYRKYLNLKSRIVWYLPSRLSQGRINYTNNYDTIFYFVKGEKARCFNLDSVRVPQLVELEHRFRCERVPSVVNGRYGKTRFDNRGKNPGDVWGDIKALTYRSKELVDRRALNTVQKPEQLIERLVLASSCEGDLVFDPFSGVGTCPVVCKRLSRRFVAFEINTSFVAVATRRLEQMDCSLDKQPSLDLAHGF